MKMSERTNTSRGQGRQAYNQRRRDTFREKKSNQVDAADKERIRSKLFVGTDEEEAGLRLQQQAIAQAKALSVTTRGIGIGTSKVVAVTSMHGPNINIPDIYALYRVFLAMFEAKMEYVRRNLGIIIPNTEAISNYRYDSSFITICQSVTMVPTRIRNILNAIGVLELDGRSIDVAENANLVNEKLEAGLKEVSEYGKTIVNEFDKIVKACIVFYDDIYFRMKYKTDS